MTAREDAPSRGRLVTDFLVGREGPEGYLHALSRRAQEYNGFSILAGDPGGFWGYSNRRDEIRMLSPGIHGLSNHWLDTPWPKVEKGKKELDRILAGREVFPEELFRLLSDRTQARDECLPDTGVGLDWERILSPIFIASPGYGTRSSTVILIDKSGMATFIERSFDQGTENHSTVTHEFMISP